MNRLPFGPVFTALIASSLGLFRSRVALQLEVLALRHQIGVLQRSVKRPKLTPADRALWACLCSVWQEWRSGIHIVQASTVVGWHRKDLVCFGRGRFDTASRGDPQYLKKFDNSFARSATRIPSGALRRSTVNC